MGALFPTINRPQDMVRVMERPGWTSLGRRARAFRIAHASWSVVALAALGYVWACAARRRRDRVLYASAAFLSVQGGALVVGRGNCPFGSLQASWGDPVPLFELVLPPRAARAAIPALAVITVAGLVAAVARQPELAAWIRRRSRLPSRSQDRERQGRWPLLSARVRRMGDRPSGAGPPRSGRERRPRCRRCAAGRRRSAR
jgi:hypothetical protein